MKSNISNAKYFIWILVFTGGIFLFSVIMAGISSVRNDVSSENFASTGRVYSPLKQSAPILGDIESTSDFYKYNNLSPAKAKYFVDNTYLTATDADVNINADFVKKGLAWQPTFKTQFKATYTLSNSLNEKSLIVFQFPFPSNTMNNEISNAKLVVNGEEVTNAKSTITTQNYGSKINGLRWEGEVPAKSDAKIEVSYKTVGLATFLYEGLENSKGAQNFNFVLNIIGTKGYDVVSGLSVDKREFSQNTVKLIWNKEDLYSKPLIDIAVANRLNTSSQVSRVYLTMAPIYAIFASILVYLTVKFAKGLQIFDLFLLTCLFVLYFPFIHYLSSFTIEPTMEIFSNFKNIGYYSMPLYGAFSIALVLVGGLFYYLLAKLSNFKFATKFGLPMIILFMGFFPLVVTIPQYSILLVIFGSIALMSIIIKTRIKLLQ